MMTPNNCPVIDPRVPTSHSARVGYWDDPDQRPTTLRVFGMTNNGQLTTLRPDAAPPVRRC